MSRIALCLAASIFLSSCKDDDKDNTTTTTNSAKLGANSVTQPANLPKLTSAQAKTFLTDVVSGLSPADSSNLTALLQTAGDEVGEEEEEGDDPVDDGVGGSNEPDCMSDLFDKIVVKAKGDTITFDFTADLAECYAQTFTDMGGTNVKISQATVGIYAETACAGGNYDSVNGKTVAEIGSTLEGTCAGTITTLSSNKTRLIGTATLSGQVVKFDTEDVHAESKADGSACTQTLSNGIRTENGCVQVESHTDNVNPSESYFYKSTGNNLTWDEINTGKYFSSGTLTYEINDWTATVTYTGKDVAPTYTMTNGTETTSGTLVY